MAEENDTFSILSRAEKLGGRERRDAIEKIIRAARNMRCELRIGGGRAGGINIRYGSIGYSVLDVSTQGVVKLYVSPHPSKDPGEDYVKELNDFIEETDNLKPKSFPLSNYGHLDDKIEDIPPESLEAFLEHAVLMIRRDYYAPHFEEQELVFLELDRL